MTALRALVALEAQTQWRYGIVAMVAAVTAIWTGVLAVVPAEVARGLVPWLLLLETSLLATTLAGTLVILDRGQGVLATLAVSPARTGAYLAAKVGVLTALVVASAVPVALAGRPGRVSDLLPVLAGVALTGLLTILIAVAVAVPRRSVITFMVALPLVLLPLLLPALAHGGGVRHPALRVVPVTGAMDLIRSGYADPAAGLGWSAGWLLFAGAAAAGLAWHRLRRSGQAPATTPAPSRPAPRTRPGGPVRSFLRSDVASIRRDPVLISIGLSPLLLGLALRFGFPAVEGWLADAHGFALAAYRPLLLAVAVVLHVPVTFGMVGALLVLDDVDDRAVVALRTSPLTLPRYLGYRAGVVTGVALLGLVVAVPLSGLVPVADWRAIVPATLAAALLAPVMMLAGLAVAGNKVEGVAVLKLLGVPLYLPLATWWVTGPASGLFAILPGWWVLRALWHDGAGYALTGAVLAAALVALLARRALTRLRTLPGT